jgi:hypothetical protein
MYVFPLRTNTFSHGFIDAGQLPRCDSRKKIYDMGDLKLHDVV